MIEALHDILHYLQTHYRFLPEIICIISIYMAAVLVARKFERRWPIDPNPAHSEIVADWKVTGINMAVAWLAGPLTALSSTAIVKAAGGGFIQLRTDGWWYAVSVLIFVVCLDLYRYSSHRLYHAVPFLWELHSFHHSAEALTFVTGARHHWIQRVMENACFPVLSIVFEAPDSLLILVGVIFFLPDGCAHLNVRLPLGRAITWVNSPQWHRIHHSVLPEHQNKNFASLLPLWDVVFGTAWIPRADEYPATGLVPGEKCDLMTSLVWPFRHALRRLQRHPPVWFRFRHWEGIRRLCTKVSSTHNG
jgi:sterol desaturase/sphingolipid hydroxylase (fatty acid hydroxylase superfamily)